MKKKLQVGAAAIALFVTGIAVGQNTSPRRHPQLFETQRLIEQAIQHLDTAQRANEFDMGGHAAKAKQLLGEAYNEVKAAALDANRR
jgi:hypothetical protein